VAQLIRWGQSPRWSHQFDYEFGEPLYIETARRGNANMVHRAGPASARREKSIHDLYLRDWRSPLTRKAWIAFSRRLMKA